MNSDDYVKYGLARVLGYAVAHPFQTAGIVYIIKTPSLHPFGKATAANIGKSGFNFIKVQSQITYKHLLKPGAKHLGKKIAQRYGAAQAASVVSSGAFAIGVGGAVFSLALMGVIIAAGEGQSGIQMAEGQQEYELHALRTGGGRQVVW
ncbi:MAG: hypothetical protein GY751_10180 [Bacteroidetes bacterium]|nr:hypothetical protein [Bacteroidota bacterium]